MLFLFETFNLFYVSGAEVPKQWGATPGGCELIIWGTFIFIEIWVQDKMYILIGTLSDWNILLIA
jgi:hypothetical protein